MSEPTSSKPDFDPLAMWKPFQDAWAKTMNDAVSGEEFAKAMGQSMQSYMQTAGPMRQLMETAVERYLAQMNLPARSDLTSLAERLTNLELRLDDLDAKLDEALDHLRAIREPAKGKASARGKRAAKDD